MGCTDARRAPRCFEILPLSNSNAFSLAGADISSKIIHVNTFVWTNVDGCLALDVSIPPHHLHHHHLHKEKKSMSIDGFRCADLNDIMNKNRALDGALETEFQVPREYGTNKLR